LFFVVSFHARRRWRPVERTLLETPCFLTLVFLRASVARDR